MADNVVLNPGVSGDTIAADDVGGIKYQVVKLAVGADGAASLVANANPIPISDAGGAITVDGSVSVSDGGGSLTVDGTVAVSGTVAVTDNAGSLTVDNAALSVTGGGVEASALRVTIASDSTGVVSVDDNGASLTVDGTVTANAGTGPWPVTDNGGSLTVDGTVAVSGSVTVAGAAAENAAVSGNPVLVGGRYDSSPRTLGNGDAGALALNASGQVLVEIAAGAGSGGTAAADDADFTAGTTSGTPIMGAYQSSPTAVTDGDLGIVGITADREMKVAVTSGGVAGVVEDAASAGGEEGVLMLAVRRDTAASSSGTDGDFSTLNTDSTGRLHVNVGNTVTVGSHAVTNAGTFAVQVSSLPASTNTIEVVGDAAHDAAVAGNPVLTGFEARSTAPTAVTDGDAVRGVASLLGKQIVLPYAIPASTWSYASPAAVTDTADDEAAAAVASTRRYITGVQVFNGHDTVGTEVVIKDGSTVLWRGWAEQTGGGCSAKFDPPLRGTANTAVNVANITTGSSTYFNLQGYSATE
jgi:hypothetical protein